MVPKIALRVLAVHYPERLPAHPPWEQLRVLRELEKVVSYQS